MIEDVDTLRSATTDRFRDVVIRLRAAQKSKSRGAPAYSLYVNRPAGRPLAALAYVAGLSPNAVSAVSALFTATGVVLLAVVPPMWWLSLAVSEGAEVSRESGWTMFSTPSR